MDDITAADPALILLLEFGQRSYGIIGTGFDLNGEHLILGFAVVRNDEVNLNVIALLFFTVMGVEEQAVSIGNQHLGNHIFIKHTLVQTQLTSENLLINFGRM